MHILVLSGDEMAAEFRQKFAEGANGNTYTFLHSRHLTDDQLKPSDIVFDFLLHEEPERLSDYTPEQVVFCQAVTKQLAALVQESGLESTCTLFGFNGLPTLFNRPVLEVSLYLQRDADKLKQVCAQLGTEYQLVNDRAGMATPRILCMIINEACYTLQEGTASIQDIDLGMKLGTNYPFGPFEWANAIGIANVYQVLKAMYEDTKEERYKICPLLKTKYLRGEKFEL
ncbi:3-hydroxyacyl-CoA dehydrogenase family protein [Pontibacter ramchanderi]|uniref:3-hydroxybutyryl-CoA dehydrogenase n=1 Tax=Pontibacter ramchanderi TaxID=1179743 RepID=A0A2N3UCP5_9BACT|nr:3-hydroxyacyl-CoA dehydrogenase family protein [Pontibacter ramchanderi]PKV67159.1 3-hydroxybutyryl-CoA dehydrogenase [Pontibacter ramchanderi]